MSGGARVGIRVLQSFPHKIGAGRICTTAWHQASGVAAAGGRVTVIAGAVHKDLPPGVEVRTTLGYGRVRVPYSVLGMTRSLALHDRIVARQLPRLADRIDLVHVWPLAAVETLRTAKRLGLPTVLERPNAHTRFAYESVAAECDRLGVQLPSDHDHAYNAARLAREELEYELADWLLCPSEFVAQTFIDEGVPASKLLRHSYGYDDNVFGPGPAQSERSGLRALFAGACEMRKGLHYALEAWLQSSASRDGQFLIAGEFVPGYRERIEHLLAHPSVVVLGPSRTVPELMRQSDVLLLASVEEGAPLVCHEAIASGCVPLVSTVCVGGCQPGTNSLVHPVGDVTELARHLSLVAEDRSLLQDLRLACLRTAPQLTWSAAGERLLQAYETATEESAAPVTQTPWLTGATI